MKRPQSHHIAVLIVVGLVVLLIGGPIVYYYGNRVIKRHRREKRRREQAVAKVHKAIDQLKVPAGVIYLDIRARRLLTAARKQSFEKLGMDKVVLYSDQVSSEPISPSQDVRVYNWSHTPDSYFENHARYACERLSQWFRRGKGEAYDYLMEHPELFEKEIRPRLLLLADSLNTWISYPACKALFDGGDRSDELKQCLTKLLVSYHHPYRWSFPREYAIKLMKECGWDAPAPWPTIEELPAYSEDSPARDALGEPLPSGALLRVGRPRPLLGKPLKSCPELIGHGDKSDELFILRSGELYRVNIETGALSRIKLDAPDAISIAVVSNDGKTLATYGVYATEPPAKPGRSPKKLRRLMLWDLQTLKPICRLQPTHGDISLLKFSPDGSRLVAYDGLVCVYDLKRNQLLYRFGADFLKQVCFRPDIESRYRPRSIMGVDRGRMYAWFGGLHKRYRQEFNPLVHVSKAAVANKSDLMATVSGYDQRMVLWNLEQIRRGPQFRDSPEIVGTNQLQLSGLDHNNGGFTGALFSPDDELLVTSFWKSSNIVIWDKQGKPLGRLAGHSGPVMDMMFVGDKLVSTSKDTTLLVWDWPKIAAWIRSQAGKS